MKLLDEISGYAFHAMFLERRIRRRIVNLAESDAQEDDKRATLSLAALSSYNAREVERQRSIETKARDNLQAITISFSIVLVGIGLLADKSSAGLSATRPLDTTFISLLSLGIAFLSAAGLLAMRALDLGQTYLLTADDEALSSESTCKLRLVRCVELNELTSTIKSNYAFASNRCVRNAILSFLALSFVVLLHLA